MSSSARRARCQTIPVTPFEQNCSRVWCDQTLQAAVIDPGGDLPRIRAAAQARQLTLTQILLTHAHIGHAGDIGTLARELKLPIVGPHPGDPFWIDGLPQRLGESPGPFLARVRQGCSERLATLLGPAPLAERRADGRQLEAERALLLAYP